MTNLLTRIAETIYREYDRRIRRASLITEYGAAHHGSAHHDETAHAAGDGGEVEIANVPLGAEIPTPQAAAEQMTDGTHP